MPRFQPEPPYRHGTPAGTAIVLVNLGTPEAPTAPALRRYLKQFLSDPRVVEIPKALWWLILNGIILNIRPARSAAKYATVWTDEGSPLRVHTERQAKLLKGWLGERGHRVEVAWAMRYGQPSVAAVFDRLKAAGNRRILVVPMYPQYAASTTATVVDAVTRHAGRLRDQPELRFIKRFHEDAFYLDALAGRIESYWREHGRPQKLVMSFHGLPRYSIELGDPYYRDCMETARLLSQRLSLPREQIEVTFQSRFGAARWLEPYTEPTLKMLAAAGVTDVDVVCPGFVADCLETLEEISQECRHAFLEAGGRQFRYIPALNDDPAWIAGLAGLTARHLQGWGAHSPT